MSRVAHIARRVLHALLVVVGAVGLTLALFLVLPLFQTLAKPPVADTLLTSVATSDLPPPPPPEEEEPEEEPEQEPEPPELTEESPPLDLSQLELALDPGAGQGGSGGDFAVRLAGAAAAGGNGAAGDVEELFSMADLDQKPRIVYQPSPVLDATLRKKVPATVHVVFVVDQGGRVHDPLVQRSTDPAFERSALSAVKQWKFEPGKRNGQAVRFRMRVPITFPQG